MAKFCFVSYEIHPTVKGGCGVLLHNAAHVLLNQGHEVIFLLDIPDRQFSQFNEVDRLNLPNSSNCRAYQVQAIASDLKLTTRDFKSIFEFKAYRFHIAASEVYRLAKPDVIEFFDYCGVAYYALCVKVAGLGYHNTHLAVRLHTSIELIDRQQPGALHGIDRYIMYALEHQSLRLAETILYPSETYLDEAYRPYYETWFGNKVFSKPPLVDKPETVNVKKHPDIVLFYGRLFGLKGVDRFVDSAVLYLSDPENPRLQFYLVGYDSFYPPNSKGSYKDYLFHKIPSQYQNYFQFTGQLSWQELGDLLPQVLFAVVPSYFESFCYAAHELYEAGVPIIVSDLPAYKDYFHHEENALVFDGTISDLTRQIRRLSTDDQLRNKITRPYSLTLEPLGDFYSSIRRLSWIEDHKAKELPSLLICILCDRPHKLEKTLQSIKPVLTDRIRIVLLHPYQGEDQGHVVAWFMGKLYTFQNERGEYLYPTQIQTCQAMLLLKAGDVLDPQYLSIGLAILQRQPQITFVGSWKKIKKRGKPQIETQSLDSILEIAPFLSTTVFSRFIMRTNPGILLVDLFDPRSGSLGELGYLWSLDTESTCGIIIPDPFVTISGKDKSILDTNALDYLVVRDDNPWRKRRLSRYFLSLANRSITLKNHFEAEWLSPEWASDDILYERGGIWKSWFKTTRLFFLLNRIPWLKKAVRKAVVIFLHLIPASRKGAS